MTTRTLQQIIPSIATSDGGGVKLRRSIGQSQTLRVDPFLMLDEFSSTNPDDYLAGFPDDYLAGFPDHPHRGFETVTYMLDGHMLHQDHLGNHGDLKAGGAQWMTAGRGIIHSEMPQQESGRMRGFQLWINLPAREKLKPASYKDIQAEEIPSYKMPDGGEVKIIAGIAEMNGETIPGPIQGVSTRPLILDVKLPAGGYFEHAVPEQHNVFVYPYEGDITIGSIDDGHQLESQSAGILSPGDRIELHAGKQGAALLLLAAHPIREPIVQYGPFVMNTREEIEQAIADYKNGQLV